MVAQSFPMTEEGFKKLKAELQELESVKHARAKRRIARARSFCDFQEDSEYEAALKDFATIDDRISSIRFMLQRAKIIEKSNHWRVDIGSTVSFKELPDGESETYQIVGVEEADPVQGKISYQSPIAKQLMGKKVKDKIEVMTPTGTRVLKIVGIY